MQRRRLIRLLLACSIGTLTGFGCDDRDDESSASVDIVLDPSPGTLGSTTTSAAYVSIVSAELVACDDAGALRPFTVRRAWAHETTTSTRLGIPALDDLTGTAKTVSLGTLKPPSIDFCAVRVTFGPADADAIGMPADRSAVGRTLWISGRTAGAPSDFKLTSSERRSADFPVARFRAGSVEAVHLSRAAGDVLANVDLSPAAIDQASRTVLDRLVARTRAEAR